MKVKFLTILLTSFLVACCAHAQLCTGSLGDPIVNISFGQGSNPGPASSAATTFYQYVPNDCPNDGYYTIINNTNGCFGNSWYSVSSDHTGNGNGYFMLVNASYDPSDFYVDTVRGLCGGTTYEMAAWVMNVIQPSSCGGNSIQPNLTFSVEKTDGTILQTYNTGSIAALASPQWKQYGTFFTTPAGISDVVLRIKNNSAGGCGNDLALDDITFRPCGPLITNSIDGTATSAISFCQGELHNFFLSCNLSGGFINPTFIWQSNIPSNGNTWVDLPGLNTNAVTVGFDPGLQPGIYKYRLAVAEAGNLSTPQCRIYSTPYTFTINANPITTAVNNGPVCENNKLQLTATGGKDYAWSGPNAYSGFSDIVTINNVQFNQAGKYYVTVTSAAGCTHLDSTTVVVNPVPMAGVSASQVIICIKDSTELLASGGISYEWTPSTGLSNSAIYNPKASPATTTEYSVIVSNQFGCKDTAMVTINIIQMPVANAGPDKAILQGQFIQLQGTINGPGNSYSWAPPTFIDDINSLQPMVNPPVDTKYILTATSGFGCGISTDTVFVKVYKNIFIPNAFSPNADGINDTWNIPALEAYPSFELWVYSRWGQLVFHLKNANKSWDGTYKGKPLPVGAYSYLLDVGISQDLFKGTVLIIR